MRQPVPPDLALGSAAHVWVAELWRGDWEACAESLSPDEITHADTFRFDVDRLRYTRARAMLRTLLESYLGIHRSELEFHTERLGKPRVEPARAAGIAFNASRSHEVAICAFLAGPTVGIDVEWVREDLDFDSMAKTAFSDADTRRLARATPNRRAGSFFELWTKKEAAAKAQGSGLGADLKTVDLDWCTVPIAVPPGYVAHIATVEPLVQVSVFRYEPDLD